ncbi:MAG: PIN domain-containing protein [Candidatus Dormibacteraceae bacterium]
MFDSSALLAWLGGEAGEGVVERALLAGGCCGAANWSEVAQKVLQRSSAWPASREALLSSGIQVVPVTIEDAERAAGSWRAGDGRSLADRLCLALGERLEAEVWTADAAWGTGGRIRQIR